MTTLLCSVGTSPLVVPEAFLSAPGRYARVRCLTSSSGRVDEGLLKKFFAAYPKVDYKLERVPDLVDLRDQKEHDAFAESLFRWYLRHSDEGPVEVCLAGGFKSMVAALQKAAQLCGAQRVFHVLCEAELPARSGEGKELRFPTTLEELQKVTAAIRRIDLGPEPGWPAIRGLAHEPPPLLPLIQQRLEDINRRSDAWERREQVPFPSLALWGPADRAWLEEPLTAADRPWVKALPKIELHCHLGGWATEGPSLAAVEAAAAGGPHPHPRQAPAPPPGWPLPSTPLGASLADSLQQYMKLGDDNGSRLLKNPACLQAHIGHVYNELCAEGIRYAEIRCSPNNYAHPEGYPSAWAVLEAIRESFQSQMDAAELSRRCHVNLLIIATRKPQDKGRDAIARHLALAITAAQHHESLPEDACRVVGVDLAGFENPATRPEYYEADFNGVHRCGLAVTCHAGESDEDEAIWQAVFRLHARRIGHGLHLHQAPGLITALASRGVGLEMCPYANYQIHGFRLMSDKPDYPLLNYLNQGLPVSVNTDNPGISRASLTENFLLLTQLCPGITRLQVLRLIQHAASTAFLPAPQRRELLAKIDAQIPSPRAADPKPHFQQPPDLNP